MRLLDTDILVDLLRGYKPAVEWLETLEEAPGITGFSVMELMEGCRNNKEMLQLSDKVELFTIYWPSSEDCNRALTDFPDNYLSYNLGIMDALIGECVIGFDAVLCTFNLKHFKAIISLKTEQPYKK